MKVLRLLSTLAAFAAAPALGADPERGLIVARQWCNNCHIILQKDTGWHFGVAAPRFSLLTKKSLEDVIKLMHVPGGHGGMEALGRLKDSDIEDIVAHIKRLHPEEQF